MTGSKKGTQHRKVISAKEKQLVEYMVYNNVGPVIAAREVFKWPCEPGSIQYRKACNLNVSPRFKKYRAEVESRMKRELSAQSLLADTSDFQWDNLRQFIYKRLEDVRDDSNSSGGTRLRAIRLLEKLADPAADVNLIMLWVDLIWRASLAHCPCCHKTFPMYNIKNTQLDAWRLENDIEADKIVGGVFERRNEIIARADNRKEPHPGQIIALNAPERDIAGLGAARAGKSYLLALFALMSFMLPGTETWILAETYSSAFWEVKYLENFLNTLFYPYSKHIITIRKDSKTDELTIESKWGSKLEVKSARSKGSITGHELEMALIAEPGWVPDDVFNHLRARMTSRLGRTILLGTPQGFGGILSRFINMTGKDESGKVVRMGAEKRLISAGCSWDISLLKYSLTPEQNPEFVTSELGAARMQLTDAEYASEFQGLMASVEGALFAQVAPRHLTLIPRHLYEEATWVLGVDQGPKNFGGCLIGYSKDKILVANEYFEGNPRTMKMNMAQIRADAIRWIKQVGGNPDHWVLTIFDIDPMISNELREFEDEGTPWPTEVTFRPKNKIGRFTQENWRKETYEYINSLAQPVSPNILFDINNCELLHDQLLRAQARAENRDRDGNTGYNKGWIITDPWRHDHVVDSFVLAVYTVLSGQLKIPEINAAPRGAFEEAQAAFEYNMKLQEQKELSGFDKRPVDPDAIFKDVFGRPRSNVKIPMGIPSFYKDY